VLLLAVLYFTLGHILIRYCIIFCVVRVRSPQLSTLSLHDALPILPSGSCSSSATTTRWVARAPTRPCAWRRSGDHSRCVPAGHRSEEQRLNSSHVKISYAVFCLKKKTVIMTSTSRTIMTNTDLTLK